MRQAMGAPGALNLSPDAGLSPDDDEMAPQLMAARVLSDYVASQKAQGAGPPDQTAVDSFSLDPSNAAPPLPPDTMAVAAESAAVPASDQVQTNGSAAARSASDAADQEVAAIPASGPGPGASTDPIPPLPSGPDTLPSASAGGQTSAQVPASDTSSRTQFGQSTPTADPAGLSSRLSAGPDPLVWAIARYNPKLIPPGYVVNPKTGEVARLPPSPIPGPSALTSLISQPPGANMATPEPLGPADKQRFLERITRAAEGPLGTLSSQEEWARTALDSGLIPGVPDWAKLKAPDAKEQGLLDFIAHAEGLDDDMARRYHFASSYDIPFRYGRNGLPPKPLTQMTLAEVDAYQTALGEQGATPVGRYQFNQETLRDLKQKLRLRDSDVFTPELQDRLGRALLERKGLEDYKSGKLLPDKFQNKLAGTWASIPVYRTGLNRNQEKVRVSDEQVRAAMGPLAPH